MEKKVIFQKLIVTQVTKLFENLKYITKPGVVF